jgi:hypothetical protein
MEEIITGKTLIRDYRDVRLNINSQLTVVYSEEKIRKVAPSLPTAMSHCYGGSCLCKKFL